MLSYANSIGNLYKYGMEVFLDWRMTPFTAKKYKNWNKVIPYLRTLKTISGTAVMSVRPSK